jgi:hypothetical protein
MWSIVTVLSPWRTGSDTRELEHARAPRGAPDAMPGPPSAAAYAPLIVDEGARPALSRAAASLRRLNVGEPDRELITKRHGRAATTQLELEQLAISLDGGRLDTIAWMLDELEMHEGLRRHGLMDCSGPARRALRCDADREVFLAAWHGQAAITRRLLRNWRWRGSTLADLLDELREASLVARDFQRAHEGTPDEKTATAFAADPRNWRRDARRRPGVREAFRVGREVGRRLAAGGVKARGAGPTDARKRSASFRMACSTWPQSP